MAVIEIAKIQVRRGQENTTGIPQLAPGEFGWAEDTQHLYIGRSCNEGANSTGNTRILTEIDLGGIQSLLGNANTSTVASVYQYRTGTDYISLGPDSPQPRLIQYKLDDLVNLKDFAGSAVSLTSGTDITMYLRHAIKTLYFNGAGSSTPPLSEPRRRLMIPAGNYVVSNTIDLPPYTYLVGEGQDITTIVSTVSGHNTFRTVDAYGIHYGDTGHDMQMGSGASQGVSISNMTLAYGANNTTPNAIISLDNTKNAKIENVTFTTIGTSSFVATGTGIDIQSNLGYDESSAVSRNTNINKCHFTSLYSAVNSRGFISRPVFENNVFMNLTQGLNFAGANSVSTGTTNALITKNKFDFILNDAIHVSTNTNSSNVISTENTFYYVGNNNATPDDFVLSSTGPVITFNAPGNISSNDYFHRQVIATTSGGFYYNPLISGNARINNAATQNIIINAGATNYPIILVPLTGRDQMGIIEYQLNNADMSRKGRLTLNISADGFASVSDYYNYSEANPDTHSLLVFSTDLITGVLLNYIVVTCGNFSGNNTTLEYNLDLIV